MKIESRKFDLDHLTSRDQNLTWETIEKFDFDYDVEVTLENGDMVVTSARMSNRLRKRTWPAPVPHREL